MPSYLKYALWTDLKRRSSWALVLSMLVIGVSIGLCSVLFSVARSVAAAVQAEIIRSGATDSMEVAARPDKEYRKPWTASPIGTDDPTVALQRLVDLLEEDLGAGAISAVEPAWLSPGWVYLFLTHPDEGGAPVSVGVSLTSPRDPEQQRVEEERISGRWVDEGARPQLVLPGKVADRLWKDVDLVGEKAWLGITETSTCVEVELVGTYRRTQRNYCFANSPVARAIQDALEAMREDREPAASPPGGLPYDRVRLYFRDRKSLRRARELAEERYKFWAATPYDKFESKLRLTAAARVSAWAVFVITLGSACGAIFCTFLAWVSRRRYEIALLKAQGSGDLWVGGIYVLQSGAAGLLAGLAGVVAGSRLCPLLAGALGSELNIEPAPVLHVPPEVGVLLVAAAAGMAVLAALIPARIAARHDPWEILREAG